MGEFADVNAKYFSITLQRTVLKILMKYQIRNKWWFQQIDLY